MYTNMHLFHQAENTIIYQHSQLEENLTQYNTIPEMMGYIDQWIEENMDAQGDIYHPSKMERKTYIHSLYTFQQDGQRVDKETTKSMEICSKLHKDAQELIKGCRLLQLEELGHNLVMEELVYKIP
jgi:hypothetical protein